MFKFKLSRPGGPAAESPARSPADTSADGESRGWVFGSVRVGADRPLPFQKAPRGARVGIE